MAEFDYANSAATATRLITRFGQTVSVRRMTKSGPAWEPTLTPTDYATKGAKVDFSWRQLQSGDVLATDQRWLVSADGVPTDVNAADFLMVGSAQIVIVKVTPLAPAGTVVFYDLQVRV